MANLQKEIEPQNPDTSPELPHDDSLQLYPVFVGGVFVGFETLNEDEIDHSENESDHD